MPDDDRAVMERLAALEAEVKADADAARARKAAGMAKLRDQRVTQAAPSGASGRARSAVAADPAVHRRRAEPEVEPEIDAEGDSLDLGGALELASKAHRVKQELQRKPRKGEKSWVVSGVLSLGLGPIGWLYAGSMREAVPATAAWVALAVLASKILPAFLMMPALMVILPLSAIAGVVYALQYNRAGGRQRLFDGKKSAQPTLPEARGTARRKQLRSGH